MFGEFTSLINKMDSPEFMEIGSRVVTNSKYRKQFGKNLKYVGFDYLEGENVDVVGDAHKLSKYFPKNKFDIILSVSVLEHFIMPWKVAIEMNKVLKNGGLILTGTVFAWPLHEIPCDYFRFSKFSFDALFNKKTGFEILQVEEGDPARLVSMSKNKELTYIHGHVINMGTTALVKKISEPDPDVNWNIEVEEITNSKYPKKLA